MLNRSIFSKPRQYELPLDVEFSAEKSEVLVDLPQPGLGLLSAEQALVTPHRHPDMITYIGKILTSRKN